MSKYLVKRISGQFDEDIWISVLEVLQIIETDYGNIVIGSYRDKESWDIQCHFLNELESCEYKFSDDEKYNGWINQ